MPVYHKPFATNVPFDNSTNGFTATNVQDAIEEAALSLPNVFHQARAVVSGTSVIYTSYDKLISISLEYLVEATV